MTEQSNRLAHGGLINRDKRLSFKFNGTGFKG